MLKKKRMGNTCVGMCWCGGKLRREGRATRCSKCDRISYSKRNL